MISKKYLVTIFFCFSTFIVWSQEGKYPIKNFSPEDYKSGIQNIDFAQNRDMTLFVANNLGVLTFNGNDWKTHATNTGKKQRSLAFDEASNKLYVGSQGEFGYFEKGWEYVSLIDLIPKDAQDFDEVWDVFIHNSKVYFCTFQGIYVYDGQQVDVVNRKGGFNRSFEVGNLLFTQSDSGELFKIDDLTLEDAWQQTDSGDIVIGVISKDEGYLLFYNSGRIEFSTRLKVEPVYPKLTQTLQGKYVNNVTQLSDTRLVIATQRAGLFLFDPRTNSIENISKENGLQSNACLRAFQDHSGNLWVGMQNGIALIDISSPLRLISEEINIQGSGYEAFDRNEGRYYSTSNGIYFLANGSGQSIFLDGTEGPAYGMQVVNGKLYAGHHTGLFLLEQGTAKRCGFTDGLWQIKQLRSNPQFAIAGTYSGLHLFRLNESSELESVAKIQGFNESSRFFEEDRKGRIWVGQFYKGLYQLTFEKSLQLVSVKEISETTQLSIKEHIILSRIDDELYLGTEDGIYKIDQTRDEIVKAEAFTETIGEQWVYLIKQDNQKNVHVFTDNLVGFFKQVSANNYAYVSSSLFQLRQSFNNDLLNISTNVNEGVLFDANEGFIYYNPDLEERLTLDKKPIITRVYSVAEDSILYAKEPFKNRPDSIAPVMIIQGTKVLQFQVESFKFKDVNNKQFRYFLKGFDNDYSSWTNATFKEYTNLKEGKYEFQVQTLNHLGEVVTSEPLFLEVNPPFFKSLIAKLLYVLIAILTLFQIYRIQRKYYKSKQSRLEQTRQNELEEKQSELQELKEEHIRTELRHVNNLLAASTMNLVVKNEFMENIKEEIKQVGMNEGSEETQKALKQIIKEIDTTLKLQEDWKQFEYHFDKVHGDFLTRLTSHYLDLTPGEQKLCAFLRLKMDTKEIANLMGVSLRGVEVARYRLRKKLNLDQHQNLSKFILEF